MNETEQEMPTAAKQMSAQERSAIIRHLCREVDYMNEFVIQPTQETQDYIGTYVDRRAADPIAAAEEFRGLEHILEQARQFKAKRAVGDLGKQGVRYGF